MFGLLDFMGVLAGRTVVSSGRVFEVSLAWVWVGQLSQSSNRLSRFSMYLEEVLPDLLFPSLLSAADISF